MHSKQQQKQTAKKPSKTLVLREQGNRSLDSSLKSQYYQSFVNTLRDPWDYPPVKIGFGCCVNTILATGYVRYNFLVSAIDGSFAVGFLPDIMGTLQFNNTNTSSTTWSEVGCSNNTGISSQIAEARVVSGGLRVMVMYPMTSAGGVLFGGAFSSQSKQGLRNLSPTALVNLGTSELGVGSRGARTLCMPLDLSAMQFHTAPINGYAMTDVPFSSMSYVVGQNFPIGSRVYAEIILNLEGTPQLGSNSIDASSASQVAANTLSSVFPNVETLLANAKQAVGSPVVMDAVEGMASLVSPNLGRAIRSGRSLFGAGRHLKSAISVGAKALENSRRDTIIIEEIKDGL